MLNITAILFPSNNINNTDKTDIISSIIDTIPFKVLFKMSRPRKVNWIYHLNN